MNKLTELCRILELSSKVEIHLPEKEFQRFNSYINSTFFSGTHCEFVDPSSKGDTALDHFTLYAYDTTFKIVNMDAKKKANESTLY